MRNIQPIPSNDSAPFCGSVALSQVQMMRQKIFAVLGRKASCFLLEESGATIVETAISLTLLVSFLLGTFQMALALYTYHFVSDAAREASRYAIVRGSTSCANTPNLTNCGVTADQLQTWVRNLGYPGINPTRLTVTTTWPTTGSTCYPSSTPCNNPSNLVNVVVKYAFPLDIPFWKSATINVQSGSQMVISQ